MLKRITALLSSMAVLSAFAPNMTFAESENTLADSGIDYTESVGTIQNPGAGYTTTVWANCAPNSTKVYEPSGSVVLFFINIGAFSSGINGTKNDDGTYTEGTDYDLDETFFSAWRQTFDNCRKSGSMIAVRFRYDDNGIANPEPATFEQMLKHVQQIKESRILEDNKDILAFVECGFVGKWGEQHGGKYTDTAHKAQLLDAMLDAVPENVPVTVRTPDIFAEWAGVTRDKLDDEELFASGENQRLLSKRVGMYNDGYMGSNSDLGTFSNREKETNWLHRVTEETYYGGEFSGNLEFAQQYENYLPENAIPEMYKTHLSYINSNIFQLYKDFTFGKEYDVEGVDNSAYYGQTVFQFIRDHLGYRFVIRKAENSAKVQQGGELVTSFDIENTGFANPVFHPYSYLILEKDGKFYETEMPVSVHDWKSCTVSENSFKWHIPDNIETGKWNIYIRSSVIEDNYSGDSSDELIMPKYAIRFANNDVWNGQLGANFLGSFEVTENSSHGSDNSFREVNSDSDSVSAPLTLNELTVVDGEISNAYEWQDSDKIAESETAAVSVKADDKYFYVMAQLPEGAKAPVYNIQVRIGGEYYWMYYASNGFVYFNHDSYAGCMCKWKGNTAEFRIPFEIMGLSAGAELESLRVFLQDSGNEWKLMGDVTAKNVTVPTNFTVYSTEYDIALKKGTSQEISVRCPVENISCQWYHNGEIIEGADKLSFTVTADDSAWGSYSVTLTAPNGIEKTVAVANVSEASGDILHGDANADGEVSLADAVLILQSISSPDKYGENGSDKNHITAQGAKNADVYERGTGLTPQDALQIQKYLSKLITTLD